MRHKTLALVLGLFAVLVVENVVAEDSRGQQGGAADTAKDQTSSSGGLQKAFSLYGPFKLSIGQVDGNFGLGLTGSYDKVQMALPSLSTDTAKVVYPYIDVTTGWQNSISVDSSWRSGSDTHNYAVITAQPLVFQTLHHVAAPEKTGWEPPDPKKCAGLKPSQFVGQNADCAPTAEYLEKDTPIIGYALFPDLEYRVGKISQAGTTYNANQFVYGGGLHFYYPAQIGPYFAASPFASVGYDRISSTGDNNLPAPDGVKDKYLTADGQVAFYVPGTSLISCHRWTALAKLTTSHPTGDGGGWEVSRTYELLMQIGTSLKPAVTYKSGTDKGLNYDRQLLLGVVWSIFDRSKDLDTSCTANS